MYYKLYTNLKIGGYKMSKRLSELYGMDIYTLKANYVGKVSDIILNLDSGEVMRLALKPFKGTQLSGDDIKQILQAESVAYDEVAEVGDIILIQKAPQVQTEKAA